MKNRSPASANVQMTVQARDAAEHFGHLWLLGQQPNLEAFLADAGSLTPGQVSAVLRVDQAHRWRRGEPILAETYLEKYAVVRTDPESCLDLIYGEFILRERRGERPGLQQYLERFPEHGAMLKMQIELHQAIQDSPTISDSASLPLQTTSDCIQPPVIPDYEILGELGRGGMGIVYKARQAPQNCIVALKVILAGIHAAPAERARFRTEAEAAARLRHPNVVQIYEVGNHHGFPFLALEFMDRGSLALGLAGKPLAPRLAAELVEMLARAVHVAHQHGIIHRDLKPANVLLTSKLPGQHVAEGVVDVLGWPKITDFGLAKCLMNEDGGQTSSGAILGTPHYMAPEQAAGKTRDIGPATDVYSLGAILYEALTGRPPFTASTLFETLDMVRWHEPISPSRLAPGLPRDLVTICLKALAKEPGQRYGSADLLADDLRRFQDSLPVVARPVTRWERGWRWCRRNPIVAGLSALAIVLFVLALAGFGVSALIGTERDKALANQQRAEKAEAAALRLQQEIKIGEHLARATAASRGRQSGQRFQALAEIRAAMDLGPSPQQRVALRNTACVVLALPDLAPAERLHPFPAGSGYFDFAASLFIYALTDTQGRCTVRQTADDRELFSLPGLGKHASPLFSDDGKFLALIHHGDRVQLWNIAEATPKLVLSRERGSHFAFHPTEPHCAIVYEDGAVDVLDRRGGPALLHFAPEGLKREVAVVWHPKELLYAAYSYYKDVIQLRDCRSSPGKLASFSGPEGCTHVAWHPDGETLAVGCGDDERIHLYDRRTGEPFQTLLSGLGGHLGFNRDGDRLVRSTWAGRMQLFDVGTGRKLVETATAQQIQAPRFSSDNRRLAGWARDGKLGVWQVGDGRELRILSGASGAINEFRSTAVSPDGRLLAASRKDGFGLWDLASGKELAFIVVKAAVKHVHFEPTGALVIAGDRGILRWPIREEPTAPGQWTVGPPTVVLAVRGECLDLSRDGKVLVTCCRALKQNVGCEGGWVLHRDRPGPPIRLEDPGADISYIAISPDGRWVATSTHWGGGQVKIWDAQSGKFVKQLVDIGGIYPTFTPDGRWLNSGFDRGRLFAVGTWEPGLQVGGRATFSSHGLLCAIDTSTSAVVLVDRGTGRELARLDDPHGGAIAGGCFTPDGTRLITVGNDPLPGIRVWDLALIRQGLRDLGLDWEGEPLPVAAAPVRTSLQSTAHIDFGDFLQKLK